MVHKGLVILITGCAVTLMLFGTLCFLMTTVDPPPLPATQDTRKNDPLLDELIRVTLGPQTTDNDTESSFREDVPGLQKDYVTVKYSIQRVVPPIWPVNSKPSSPIDETVGTPKNRALNETGKIDATKTTSTLNDTSSVIKRSVTDTKQLGSDLNSIILKIMDDGGQFNIEIKIGLNDAFVKKKNETREDKIQSNAKSKYSISLKTKDNDQFKKTELAKTTILNVMPNDFVTIDEYGDHLETKYKIKNNMIQASIVDFNNSTKYNITENKATVIPIYRDVFKPIVIFYNQTKFIYYFDTKTKKNEKRDLLETSNDANDGCKTNLNSFKTTNNTAYNVTKQTKKKDKQFEKGDLFEKPNDTSDGRKTNINSSKTANTAYNLTTRIEKEYTKDEKGDLLENPNDASDGRKINLNSFMLANITAYNLTTQTEKSDLLEKSNDASNRCRTNLNSFKTANNTAYNFTTQAEKGDKKSETGDLFEKLNDASDGCKTNLNSFKTANNTAYNFTTQTEKGDKKSETGDLFEKPNDASDGCKTNLNSFKTANNAAYNVTILTEKAKLHYDVIIRNENSTAGAENSVA